MEVFARGHVFPFSKMLTFYRKDNLCLEASYSTPVPHTHNIIGRFVIGPIKPAEDGSSVKVKVKVKVDIHGILHVESAHTVTKIQVAVEEEKKDTKKEVKKSEDKKEEKVEDKMETEETAENGVADTPDAPPTEPSPEKMDKADTDDKMNGTEEIIPEEKKKPKMKTKTVQDPLEVTTTKVGFSNKELLESVEKENSMVSADKLIKDRLVAKNAVEEYVYEMRDKLYGRYEKYLSESDREEYMATLSGTENWLYEEGENCQKQVYISKLSDLKKVGDKVIMRHEETEGRQGALNLLGTSLVQVRKMLELISNKDEKYDHLTEEEVKKLSEKDLEFQGVFHDVCNKASSQVLHEDPNVTVAQINTRRKEFEDFCSPIVNKPKPKVEPPPQPEEKKEEEKKEEAPMESSEAAPDAETPAADNQTSPPAEGDGNPSMELD